MLSKDREYYMLHYKGWDSKGGGTGPFISLKNMCQWLERSGINPDTMDLYRVEVWEDGSRDRHLESIEEAFEYVAEEKGA